MQKYFNSNFFYGFICVLIETACLKYFNVSFILDVLLKNQSKTKNEIFYIFKYLTKIKMLLNISWNLNAKNN